MHVPIEMHDRLTALAAYLSEKTGQRVESVPRPISKRR